MGNVILDGILSVSPHKVPPGSSALAADVEEFDSDLLTSGIIPAIAGHSTTSGL